MIPEIDALKLVRDNYTEYSLYVAEGRAYPCIYDGCKSSYKRAIYGMWKDAPRKIQKVAELAAYALPYHPHPTSVSGVIIQLGDAGNKLKLMKTQGNWGDSSRNIQASAERYIGGMLSDTALSLLCEGIEYCDYITGEIDNKEPLALPALIPLCFINGQTGIPSGLPKLNIPAINLSDMFDYYLDIIKHKDIEYVPKIVPQLNTSVEILSSKEEWQQVLLTGKGSIRFAPKMELRPDNSIVITALPESKNIEHIRKILATEIAQDKIDVRDESTADICIVIEKVYRKQCDMNAVYKKVYQKLQSSTTYNMAFFGDNKLYLPCSFDSVVKKNLQYIIKTHKNRIGKQLEQCKRQKLVLDIIEQLKDHDLKRFFTLSYDDAISSIISLYHCDEEIAKAVLSKPISYLTKAHQKEIDALIKKITELEEYNIDIWKYLTILYKDVKRKVIAELKSQGSKMQ